MSVPDASLGLVRIRIALLAAGYVIVGAVACGIFDRWEVTIVVAPLPPAVAALVTAGRSSIVRVAGAIAAIAASTVVAVAVVGGGASDVVDAVSSGFQGLFSTEWPSPRQPALVGTVAFSIAGATALSAELARRARFHLAPLVVLVITYVAAVALSSPRGVDWIAMAALAVVAVVFALFRSGSLHERIVLLRGERRLVLLVVAAAVLTAAALVPVSLTARADPRTADPPARTAPLLDPIEATLALRDLDPAIALYVLEAPDEVIPARWRTAALTNYNGDRWTPDLVLRQIGTTLGTPSGPTIEVAMTFLDDDLSLVPLPGPPVSVDAAVETDVERTVVRLVERPDVGERIDVVSEVMPSVSASGSVGVAGRLVGDDVSALTELADALAGDGDPLQRLTRLASTMREDFVLDNGVQGGGLQRAFIELFLRDTQRGNTEQFVTGFVLLARSLGVDARVATGFVMPATGAGAADLRSSDATVWPEVRLSDGRWVAFDPVPDEEASDQAPPPPQPQTQSPAAPQPPIAPPPEPDREAPPTEPDAEPGDSGPLSAAITWGLRAVAVVGIALLPFVIAAALILGLKRRRRARRLGAAEPTDRIRGAWATATDALVDAGMTIGEASTDAEIAHDGEPLAPSAGRELHRLASLSSAATYGTPRHVDLLADDAVSCLTVVETSMTTGRTRRQQLAWRLSLRSLRRTTRSPVTA